MASITNIQLLAKKLGLHHMSKMTFGLREEGIPNLDFLEYVLERELELRENKKLVTLKKASRLPDDKILEVFDLEFQKGISKWQLDKLNELKWVEEKYNLLLMGETGVGKTHLAIGLGIKAIENSMKVFYTSLDNLLYMLKTKNTIAKSKARLEYINECKLLIIDEIGYLPLTVEDAKLVYSFIDARNKMQSLIIITNREFESWKDLFHDEVMAMTLLDRVTEKCQVIKLIGESYRYINHKSIYTKQSNTK